MWKRHLYDLSALFWWHFYVISVQIFSQDCFYDCGFPTFRFIVHKKFVVINYHVFFISLLRADVTKLSVRTVPIALCMLLFYSVHAAYTSHKP